MGLIIRPRSVGVPTFCPSKSVSMLERAFLPLAFLEEEKVEEKQKASSVDEVQTQVINYEYFKKVISGPLVEISV